MTGFCGDLLVLAVGLDCSGGRLIMTLLEFARGDAGWGLRLLVFLSYLSVATMVKRGVFY